MSHQDENYIQRHEPTCRPLDSFEDIAEFLQYPPSWRSLCKELTPHSSKKIRNMCLNSLVGAMGPDRPPTFCHFSPDGEDVERHDADSLPKTLVCHDMANGYHDDSKIDGTSNHTAYSFYHWAGIDIFCYFSHHLITIPPLSWINVGHAHGVQVIGTIITEWTEGYDFWDFVLSSEFQYKDLACALVSVAKLLRFDGWLLNVENKVSQPLVLVDFVRYFHRKLHEELPHAVLIWYDSVTIKGNLNWQNALNEHNKDFFDACDGIFTNYSWKETDVAASAALAGARLTDLYIGIDVWGRNFYGGGQFNTAEAMELASGYGCSLAIFAPAWTHEAAEKRDADVTLGEHLDPSQLVTLRERALWGSLWPFLATRLPNRLPFQTSFCQGAGLKRRLYGEVLCPSPWYNLRHMQYQPNSAYGPHGYLLNTPERIHNYSRTKVTRDKKGIIKYDSAFEMLRHELHTVRSARELEEQREYIDSLTAVDEDHSHDEKKHSVRNVFKHMFRLKSRRDSDEESEKSKQSHDKAHDQDIHEHTHEHTDEHTDKHTGEHTDKHTDEHTDKQTDEHEKTKAETHKKPRAHVHIDDDAVHDGSMDHSLELSRDGQSIHSGHSGHSAHSAHSAHSTHSTHSSHSWHDVTRGWSLRQLSVHLKLGSSHKTRLALACVPGELPCLEPYYQDSYIGGSCLIIHPSDQLSPEHRWTRLFHCEFPCPGDLVLCVVTKTLSDHEEQYLDVKIFGRDVAGDEVRVSCVGRHVSVTRPSPSPALAPARPLTLYPLSPGKELKALQKYLLLNEPGFYMSPENSYGWKVRYYIAGMEGATVTSVNLHCGLNTGPILLGHIGLCLRREVLEGEWSEAALSDPVKSFTFKPVEKSEMFALGSHLTPGSDSQRSRVARDVQGVTTLQASVTTVPQNTQTSENATQTLCKEIPSKDAATIVNETYITQGTNTEEMSMSSNFELDSSDSSSSYRESVSGVSLKPCANKSDPDAKLHLKLSDSATSVPHNPSPSPPRRNKPEDPEM